MIEELLVDSCAGSSWDLDQDRAHYDVNEIDTDNTDGDSDNPITTSTGTNWADPAYDEAGNATTIPQPADGTSAFVACASSGSKTCASTSLISSSSRLLPSSSD